MHGVAVHVSVTWQGLSTAEHQDNVVLP